MALCNAPAAWVDEVLEGVVATSSEVTLVRGPNLRLVLRSEPCAGVALLSGGGSGHEPAHAGFVGGGMLSSAVCGDVFASPTAAAVLHGIERSDAGAGVLLIVKNYTGDRLNFGLAAEWAKTKGLFVESVIVGDGAPYSCATCLVRAHCFQGTWLTHARRRCADVSLPKNAVTGRRCVCSAPSERRCQPALTPGALCLQWARGNAACAQSSGCCKC